MGKPELLPCPFCGGQADIGQVDDVWFIVTCVSCEADGSIQHGPDDAAATWNRRTAPPVVSPTPRKAKCGHVAYRNHDDMCIEDACPDAAYQTHRSSPAIG